jgi:hypothetical protein
MRARMGRCVSPRSHLVMVVSDCIDFRMFGNADKSEANLQIFCES